MEYGILHQESDKVYTFLRFDVMEGFRHSFVDRIVIWLVSKKILQIKHSRKYGDGVYLSKYGQGILSNALYKERMKKMNKLISSEVGYLVRIVAS